MRVVAKTKFKNKKSSSEKLKKNLIMWYGVFFLTILILGYNRKTDPEWNAENCKSLISEHMPSNFGIENSTKFEVECMGWDYSKV